ncbi:MULTISPECIES: cytochrome P450 [Thermomonosporaceae]|uniref:cytochrome P450 n=1 Tax=Thermomonosporaceae TaxID=2012 RepID=UPI00255B2E45|nr:MULTISPECIES: cytochrome P450 [Thermomonosporaceae]MDL4777346.1 cytochrome P450 [Actinomadura xylanilytica]
MTLPDQDVRPPPGPRGGGTGRRRPPGPPRTAMPILLAGLARDRLAVMRDAAARYGDAVRLPLGPTTLYFFNHPDHAKHVLADNSVNYRKGIGLTHARRALGDGLLTSEGELWRRQRKAIQPVFHARRMAGQATAIAEEAAGLVERLRAKAGQGPVDVRAEMTGLTLGVLGRALLDADLGAFGSVGEAFESVQDQAIFEMMSLSSVPSWLPLPKQRRYRRARGYLDRVVGELITQAGAHAGGDDVMARLLGSVRSAVDGRVIKSRLRDELVTLLLAGHETTASTLSWAFHLIDRHPEVAARLRAEAREVLGDRLPEYADLHRLTYTGRVIEEVMRLYPPVWILPRLSLGEDEIGGYHVPAGAKVMICPYTLHRDPRYWADPDRFDPDRFDTGRPGERPAYSYIPFGAGPRFCVGKNLGLIEAVFVLALVSRDLRLAALPGHRVRPEAMLSLRVRGGLPMNVRPASG